MTYDEFVEHTIESSGEDGPFCPFLSGGYCDTPCSDECYVCDHSLMDYTIYTIRLARGE